MRKLKPIAHATFAISAGLVLSACSSTRYDDDYSYSRNPVYGSDGAESYYSESEYSSVDNRASIDEASGAQNIDNEIVIPLHEEQVNIGKRTVDAGEVTIRKIVTTETVNQPVQLRRETLVIDRGESSGYSRTTQSNRDTEWQSGARSDSSTRSETQSPRASEQDSTYQRSAATANEASGATFDRRESSTEYTSQEQTGARSGQSDSAFEEETFTIRLREERPVVEKTIIQTGRVTARKNSQMEQRNISEQVRREDVELDRGNARNVQIRGDFQSAGQPLREPSGAERQQNLENQDQEREQQQNPAQPDSADQPNQPDQNDTP